MGGMVRSWFLLASWAHGQHVGYPLAPVSFERVTLADEFWLPRLQLQRRVLVPYSFEQTHEARADLQAAADMLAGRPLQTMPEKHRFRTSDLFKVMEGAAYLLTLRARSCARAADG